MNLADQIEAIARRATARVVAASNEFSATQRRLVAACAEHRAATATADERLRGELHRESEVAETAIPRILLPADQAAASPHTPVPDESVSGE
ncbi:hypothetical protein VX037_10430 [Gordonia sp. Z-3]|jgi:hypothetical protein|uniref:Uncharacterized protein n=2 Tax=Gordonia TaxID=2053 RepID=A0A9X3CZX8_9ACTN|nr:MULTISPECIES: hypothetical protein [Gordonia]MAU83537.1 hypothetical protein [Gordonia sp. (in: high G+C Gram-positive bacteria)]MCF3938966.1 hypothetical protein [Gordonia tangerina]MCX2962529.1 hypothetical protein [Gordonia aquimaris]MED5801441.1 hypothetical protein [Gordonia sp. Z-3]